MTFNVVLRAVIPVAFTGHRKFSPSNVASLAQCVKIYFKKVPQIIEVEDL